MSKIKQFYSKNQFINESEDKVTFQSYDKVIALYDKKSNTLTLDTCYRDYSRTTSKYLYRFINEYCYNAFCRDIYSKTQVKYLIKYNKVILEDLNK